MIICLWESARFFLVIYPPYHDAKECSQSCNWTQTDGKYNWHELATLLIRFSERNRFLDYIIIFVSRDLV